MAEKTKKYVVLRDCYGFMNRHWPASQSGEFVELPADAKPPHHFHDLSKGPAPAGHIRKPAITPEKLRRPSFTEQMNEELEDRKSKQQLELEGADGKDQGKTDPKKDAKSK